MISRALHIMHSNHSQFHVTPPFSTLYTTCFSNCSLDQNQIELEGGVALGEARTFPDTAGNEVAVTFVQLLVCVFLNSLIVINVHQYTCIHVVHAVHSM